MTNQTMYSFFEWAKKVTVPIQPRERSNSVAELMSTGHIATNPCNWVIVDSQRNIVTSSSAAAEATARRTKIAI